ncbi:hypothetical protein D3C76_1497240 [compost metagenome]
MGEDVALVHAALDHVPGDAVLRLLPDDRPDRGIQPGQLRQRAVMEIDRAALAPRQHCRAEDREVRNAEKPVGIGGIGRERRVLILGPQPGPFGPGAQVGIARDHGGDTMPAPDQRFRRMAQEKLVTDQNRGKLRHG